MRIGITQGRLLAPLNGKIQTFPGPRWRDEFDLCRGAGFDSIEWVHSGHDPEYDPIVSKNVQEIQTAISRAGVDVPSVCYDAILDHPILEPVTGREVWMAHWNALETIAINLEFLGGSHIVLPLLGANKVISAADREAALGFVRGALKALNGTKLDLHLETSLQAGDLKSFLHALGDSRCKVTFDTGNILQFGYDLRAELENLSPEIGSVHFKDSKFCGTTVPLGTGDVDFDYVGAVLRRNGYRGYGVLQGARVEGRNDFDLCSGYLKFLREHLEAPDR
jgi:L-ribulose-5-phosphate 3-epimerase